MSEGLTFSRPPNPIFKPGKRMTERDHLYSRLMQMPPMPAVWPEDYPFDLAWHFLEYLQGLSTARMGVGADYPPPSEQ